MNTNELPARKNRTASEILRLVTPEHMAEEIVRLDALLADRERQAGEAVAWREALHTAEAALADIGDADREPGDDVAWCEARAAQALPQVRAVLASLPAPQAVQADNTKMWAVHIIGPDDVHAAPDREVADAACVALNWSFKRTGQDDLCRAEVIEWPHGYESWTAQKDLFQLAAAPSPDGKAERPLAFENTESLRQYGEREEITDEDADPWLSGDDMMGASS